MVAGNRWNSDPIQNFTRHRDMCVSIVIVRKVLHHVFVAVFSGTTERPAITTIIRAPHCDISVLGSSVTKIYDIAIHDILIFESIIKIFTNPDRHRFQRIRTLAELISIDFVVSARKRTVAGVEQYLICPPDVAIELLSLAPFAPYSERSLQ